MPALAIFVGQDDFQKKSWTLLESVDVRYPQDWHVPVPTSPTRCFIGIMPNTSSCGISIVFNPGICH